MSRPEVWLNCAISLDGRLAGPGGEPVRLSDEADMDRVHAMRAKADAILVGVETVIKDDPGLRVDPARAQGPDPLRVVLDTRARVPRDARLVTDDGPTLLVVAEGKGTSAPDGPAVQEVATGRGGLDLAGVLATLHEQGITSVMVEGGGRVLRSFLETALWDRFTVFQAPIILGDGPVFWPGGAPGLELPRPGIEAQDGGVLWTFSPGP